MNTKIISIVLVLFGFYSNVELVEYKDVVPHIRKVYAIGWKEHPFPTDMRGMQKICTNIASALGEPDLVKYFENIFPKISVFRKEGLNTFKAVIPGKTCGRALNNDTKIIPLLKELNSKVDKLTISRDNFAKVFADANKPDTKVTPSQLLCWLNNYVNDSASHFTGEVKELVIEYLSVFKVLFKKYKADEKCPWPTEKPKPEEIQAVEDNYVRGSVNSINKYPPK